MNIERLKSLGLNQSDIARRLDLTPSAISMKVGGERPWKRDEIDAVLEMAKEHDPAITYEQLFCEPATPLPPTQETDPEPESATT